MELGNLVVQILADQLEIVLILQGHVDVGSELLLDFLTGLQLVLQALFFTFEVGNLRLLDIERILQLLDGLTFRLWLLSYEVLVLVLQLLIGLVELGLHFGAILLFAFELLLEDFVLGFELAEALVTVEDVVAGLLDLQLNLLNLLRVDLELPLPFLLALLEGVDLGDQLVVT